MTLRLTSTSRGGSKVVMRRSLVTGWPLHAAASSSRVTAAQRGEAKSSMVRPWISTLSRWVNSVKRWLKRRKRPSLSLRKTGMGNWSRICSVSSCWWRPSLAVLALDIELAIAADAGPQQVGSAQLQRFGLQLRQLLQLPQLLGRRRQVGGGVAFAFGQQPRQTVGQRHLAAPLQRGQMTCNDKRIDGIGCIDDIACGGRMGRIGVLRAQRRPQQR